MKVPVREVEDEGFEALLNESVFILCMNYFYTGKLVGVNDACVKLEDPAIVYNTGQWKSDGWADMQSLHTDVLYVQRSSIEAFCKGR